VDRASRILLPAGLGNHEGPFLAEGCNDRLAEDMVVSVEPGIYLPGLGGFRHSDTVFVTESGNELLTQLPTDIETLSLRGLRLWARIKGQVVRWSLGLLQKAAARESHS
jgi:Xaa-Pro dipeptidase